MTQSGYPATNQFHQVINLVGNGAQALEALQNDCVPSRLVALGDPGCEHLFKVIHDLRVPFRAALINAAVKYRFLSKQTPVQRRERTRSAPHLTKLLAVLIAKLVRAKRSVW